MKKELKYFSWKWVAYGFAYAWMVTTILNLDMPAEMRLEPFLEEWSIPWIMAAYSIATTANCVPLSAILVLTFSAYPWAENKKLTINKIVVTILAMLLTIMGMALLLFVLTELLIGVSYWIFPAFIFALVLCIQFALVFSTMLTVILHELINIIKKLFVAFAHNLQNLSMALVCNTRLAIAQDD